MSTYGWKRNNAYEGEHITKSGARAFKVYYIGRNETTAINMARVAAGLKAYPRGHRHRLKCGWYWITVKDQAAINVAGRVGPFTSSGGAYFAAIDKLDNGKE